VRSEALQEAQTDGWITNEPTGTMPDGSGGDSSAAPAAFEGHATDPRPVDDDVVTGAGGTASSTPQPSEAGGRDPWTYGPAGGQPNTSPPDEARATPGLSPAREGTTAPSLPPAREGTNAPPPREPKDPDPNRN